MMCISVDLPEPDGPVIATSSFSPIRRDTVRSATTSSSPVLYTFVTSTRSITGVAPSVSSEPKAADGTEASGTAGFASGLNGRRRTMMRRGRCPSDGSDRQLPSPRPVRGSRPGVG